MIVADDIVITGMGTVCCAGAGPAALWRAMSSASSTPLTVTDPHANMDNRAIYSVPDALPAGDPNDAWPLGRATGFALEAATQAVEEAKLDDVAPARVATVVGTGMGDYGLFEGARATGIDYDRWLPAFSVSASLAMRFGFTGPAVTVSNACAASGYALAIACDTIRSGAADVVIAGGAEAYSRVGFACFNRLGAVDPIRCRPFDAERLGTVCGEGAAVFVVERADHARARNAGVRRARLSGTGWSCDAFHSTAPESEGHQIVRAMHDALAEAGTAPDAVGCVVPHGTGTQLNDTVEARAIGTVFGARTPDTPLYSLKGLIGHTGGAAGAFAIAAATLMLERDTIAPNVALGQQDPECQVMLPAEPMPLGRRAILVNAYAFGGNNISVVVEPAGEG